MALCVAYRAIQKMSSSLLIFFNKVVIRNLNFWNFQGNLKAISL